MISRKPEQLTTNKIINDEFIENRIKFIKQLIVQRKLNVNFDTIQQETNIAKKILDAKELKTKNDQLILKLSNTLELMPSKQIQYNYHNSSHI